MEGESSDTKMVEVILKAKQDAKQLARNLNSNHEPVVGLAHSAASSLDQDSDHEDDDEVALASVFVKNTKGGVLTPPSSNSSSSSIVFAASPKLIEVMEQASIVEESDPKRVKIFGRVAQFDDENYILRGSNEGRRGLGFTDFTKSVSGGFKTFKDKLYERNAQIIAMLAFSFLSIFCLFTPLSILVYVFFPLTICSAVTPIFMYYFTPWKRLYIENFKKEAIKQFIHDNWEQYVYLAVACMGIVFVARKIRNRTAPWFVERKPHLGRDKLTQEARVKGIVPWFISAFEVGFNVFALFCAAVSISEGIKMMRDVSAISNAMLRIFSFFSSTEEDKDVLFVPPVEVKADTRKKEIQKLMDDIDAGKKVSEYVGGAVNKQVIEKMVEDQKKLELLIREQYSTEDDSEIIEILSNIDDEKVKGVFRFLDWEDLYKLWANFKQCVLAMYSFLRRNKLFSVIFSFCLMLFSYGAYRLYKASKIRLQNDRVRAGLGLKEEVRGRLDPMSYLSYDEEYGMKYNFNTSDGVTTLFALSHADLIVCDADGFSYNILNENGDNITVEEAILCDTVEIGTEWGSLLSALAEVSDTSEGKKKLSDFITRRVGKKPNHAPVKQYVNNGSGDSSTGTQSLASTPNYSPGPSSQNDFEEYDPTKDVDSMYFDLGESKKEQKSEAPLVQALEKWCKKCQIQIKDKAKTFCQDCEVGFALNAEICACGKKKGSLREHCSTCHFALFPKAKKRRENKKKKEALHVRSDVDAIKKKTFLPNVDLKEAANFLAPGMNVGEMIKRVVPVYTKDTNGLEFIGCLTAYSNFLIGPSHLRSGNEKLFAYRKITEKERSTINPHLIDVNGGVVEELVILAIHPTKDMMLVRKIAGVVSFGESVSENASQGYIIGYRSFGSIVATDCHFYVSKCNIMLKTARHDGDTEGGCSGSAATDNLFKLLGIHTSGALGSTKPNNSFVPIADYKAFIVDYLSNCLAKEGGIDLETYVQHRVSWAKQHLASCDGSNCKVHGKATMIFTQEAPMLESKKMPKNAGLGSLRADYIKDCKFCPYCQSFHKFNVPCISASVAVESQKEFDKWAKNVVAIQKRDSQQMAQSALLPTPTEK